MIFSLLFLAVIQAICMILHVPVPILEKGQIHLCYVRACFDNILAAAESSVEKPLLMTLVVRS